LFYSKELNPQEDDVLGINILTGSSISGSTPPFPWRRVNEMVNALHWDD
jgi:hypothetical protein